MSTELEELKKKIQGGSSQYVDPDDPPVWKFGNPFAAIWDPNADASKLGYYSEPLSKSTLSFYNLSRDELLRFQELAFQAGYYGTEAERSDIRWQAYDDKTFEIWSGLNSRAARVYAAGKKNTIWDLLQDDVNKRPEKIGKKKREKPLVTELPDPRDIEELVRNVAPEVIGRDPDPTFTQDFISMYTRIVREFQENKYYLEGTEEGGTIQAPPSAEALASFRLRTENPEQYEEKRAAARQAAYTSLLKGAL